MSMRESGEAPWELPDLVVREPVPLQDLPELLAQYLPAVADHLQVPVDLVLADVLAVLSGCTRGRFLVSVPELGWTEHLSLYVAVFMKPGERKSPTLKLTSQPMHTFERELQNRTRAAVDLERERQSMLDERVKSLRSRVARNPNDMNLRADFDAAVKERAECQQVYLPRLLAQDITPERIGTLTYEQRGTLTLISAEGGLITTLSGRYAADGKSNLDLVNQAYSGESVMVDRQGRDAVRIDNPHLAILLAVQPAVLQEMKRNSDMTERGFLDRWLLVEPETRMGYRTLENGRLPDSLQARYSHKLHALLERATGLLDADDFQKMNVEPEAWELFRYFYSRNEKRLRETGDLAQLSGWGSKLPGAVLRIAALLQLFDEPNSESVSGEAMQSALSLAEYLTSHVLHARGNSLPRDAERALAIVADLPSDTFTTRDVQRKAGGQAWGKSADTVRTQLQLLRDLGYLRDGHKPRGVKGEHWQRHPELLTVFSAA